MTEMSHPESQVGVTLAHRLGLQTDKREGHDLAGPCIACKSSPSTARTVRSAVMLLQFSVNSMEP